MDPAWITALTALAVAVGALVLWGGRHAWRIVRRTSHFLDSYFGQPAHDGVSAQPGVQARLEHLTGDLAKITAQVFPNGGTSLRDAVDQVVGDVGELRRRMELFETERARREETR